VKRAPALLACFGALVLAAACADLKTAGPSSSDANGSTPSGSSGASSSGSSGDGTTASSSGGSSSGSVPLGPGKGPGPYGALPSGYCCNSDDECRGRHCADVGGQKMCLDGCYEIESCQGKGLPSGFTCDGSRSEKGWCQPPSGFTCLAANTFVTGTKPAGSCCTATGNGVSGLECAGGHCDWFKRSQDPDYDPPFFCTNWCDVPADCGKGMVCELQINKCVPANEPFVCE
jgi:hypothetical protein